MSVRSKLTMTCSVVPVTGQTTEGEVSYGTAVNGINCFIFGNSRRLRNESNEEYVPDYQILFLPGTNIDVNFKIENVIDRFGRLVLKSAIVQSLNDNHHPKRGLVLRQAFVAKR